MDDFPLDARSVKDPLELPEIHVEYFSDEYLYTTLTPHDVEDVMDRLFRHRLTA